MKELSVLLSVSSVTLLLHRPPSSYEVCPLNGVRRSIKQELAILITYNSHISLRYSLLLCTQFLSSAPRFTGIWIVGWRRFVEL